jgi:hypothetical protein
MHQIMAAADIMHELKLIIGDMLDDKALVCLHMTCDDLHLTFRPVLQHRKKQHIDTNIGRQNGKRYDTLFAAKGVYDRLHEEFGIPSYYDDYQPSGTMSWSRMYNTYESFTNQDSEFNTYELFTNQDNYEVATDHVRKEWFDNIREGDEIRIANEIATIISKSIYSHYQVLTENGIRNVTPATIILIPPRTDILLSGHISVT